MDKWNELKQHICQRMAHLRVLAREAAAEEDWELYASYQGKANEPFAILVVMDGIEEELDE